MSFAHVPYLHEGLPLFTVSPWITTHFRTQRRKVTPCANMLGKRA
jgi:hypothetical protein